MKKSYCKKQLEKWESEHKKLTDELARLYRWNWSDELGGQLPSSFARERELLAKIDKAEWKIIHYKDYLDTSI